MSKHEVFVSIIVPAFRAERSIANDLLDLKKVLEKTGQSFEVVCVADGFADVTYKKALDIHKRYPKIIRVFGYSKNKGKGYAVRFGMKKAKGKLIGFIDAGGEIIPESLLNLLDVQRRFDADIVVGSKRHPDSKVQYPLFRRIISLIYFLLVKLLFRVRVKDTQAGVKIFKRNVIDTLIPKLSINGFAFDIEMLVFAEKAGFDKIYESPIEVRMSKATSTIPGFSLLTTSLRMFTDTLIFFFRNTR